MLIKPTLEEVELAASKIGLPLIEAEKFFYHYESNGWKVGKVRMVSLNGALAGWKIRWQERRAGLEQPQKKGWQEKEIEAIHRQLFEGKL